MNDMLPDNWYSKRLLFNQFRASEAALAQKIYNANAHLRSRDPHFGEYPLSEFSELIQKDETVSGQQETQFFLRCVRDRESSEALGYFQFELNAPQKGQGWLPMFVLHPGAQRMGYGAEAINSLLEIVGELNCVNMIGLNVYAENPVALQFWFRQGWREILGVDFETLEGESYTCITLARQIASGESLI